MFLQRKLFLFQFTATVRVGDLSLAGALAILALIRSIYATWGRPRRERLPMQADYAATLRGHRINLPCLDRDIAALVEPILGEAGSPIKNARPGVPATR